MTRTIALCPRRSLRAAKMIIKANFLKNDSQKQKMTLMITIKVSLRCLKVHLTAKLSSWILVRLTNITSVLLSQVTLATVPVMNAEKPSLILATRLNAKITTMMNALSAARRIG
jgi:hypothetical protein